MQKEETKEKTAKLLKSGMSYPAARAEASGEYGKVLSEPNNILAIEYLKALSEIRSDIIPSPVLRKGCEHDAKTPEGDFASASYLRNAVKTGKSYCEYIPKTTADILGKSEIYENKAALDAVITYLLRTLSAEEISMIADVSEGLEHRLKEAARLCYGFDEISDFVKTKRYTKTRIDRILINVLLSIKKDDLGRTPEYIRVLGFNEKGRSLLSEIKQKSELPIITKVADAHLSERAEEMFSKDIYATDIYSIIAKSGNNKRSGLDYIKSPIILK